MTWDDDAAEEFFEAEESYYMDAEEEYDIQEQRRSVTSRNRRNGLEPELPDGRRPSTTPRTSMTQRSLTRSIPPTLMPNKRLNKLRQSRGFYPVVAVVEGKGQEPH